MLKIDTQTPPKIHHDSPSRHAPAAARAPRLLRHDPGPGDTLDLSAAAAAAAADESRLRAGLIERIRGEIEAGRYLTDAKLDIAAERLHCELRGARA